VTAVVGRARGAPSFAPLTPRDQRRDNAGHGRRPSVLMRTSAKQIVRLEAVLILPDPVQGCDLLRPISALRTVPDVTQGHGPCLGWRDVRYYSTESNSRFAVTDDMADHGALASVGREARCGLDIRSERIRKRPRSVVKRFNIGIEGSTGAARWRSPVLLRGGSVRNLFVLEPTKAIKRRIAVVDHRWFASSKPSCGRKESGNRRHCHITSTRPPR